MIERPLGHGRLPGPGHMSTQSLVEFVCVVFWSHTHPSKHKHTYWGVSRKPGSIRTGLTTICMFVYSVLCVVIVVEVVCIPHTPPLTYSVV